MAARDFSGTTECMDELRHIPLPAMRNPLMEIHGGHFNLWAVRDAMTTMKIHEEIAPIWRRDVSMNELMHKIWRGPYGRFHIIPTPTSVDG
ncbi:hypothetical protein AC1031_016086 [Aphanomyces cochlioides]|nr:hypothetical protein AC1031_016086 [Aphanomyces cochlioides]